MAQGHVFVVRSRLERFAWSALIVPTSGAFGVRPHWHAAIGSDGAGHKPEGWATGSFARSRQALDIWFIDVTGDVDRLGIRLERLFDEIARQSPEPTPNTPLPRLALPVLGVGGGGHGGERGRIIKMLVEKAQEAVAKHPFDIVISAIDASDFAALQAYRRSHPGADRYVFEEKAIALARLAKSGHLALFIGAGASVPAGLPSWEALLTELSGDDNKAVQSLTDPLDQGELLRKRLGSELGTRVSDLTDAHGKHALSHALLASLDCHEAVTTNFDECYESATQGRDDREGVTVLPWRVPEGKRPWLLKLHGSRTRPESIVLARRDFIRYQATSGPSGAILQSLLMTRHLLVVGTSFRDSNLLRLVHEVAEFRESHDVGQPMGTIVKLISDPVREDLLKDEFDHVSMVEFGSGGPIPEAARLLEIFLDVLAMHAAHEAPHLLDRRYADLLADAAERAVAAELAGLLPRVLALNRRSEAWQPVADALTAWGATRQGTQVPRRGTAG